MTAGLDVQDTGAGSPVLLLHGCPSTTRHFRPLVERLSKSMRVLLPELPGYGRTAPLEGTYSIARVGELLERELAARGIEKVAIVGHSAGVYRAFSLALSGRVGVTRIVSLAGMEGDGPHVRAAFRQFAGLIRNGHDLRSMWLARMASPGFAEKNPEAAAISLFESPGHHSPNHGTFPRREASPTFGFRESRAQVVFSLAQHDEKALGETGGV